MLINFYCDFMLLIKTSDKLALIDFGKLINLCHSNRFPKMHFT